MKKLFALIAVLIATFGLSQISSAQMEGGEMGMESTGEMGEQEWADCKAMFEGEGLSDDEIKKLCEEMKAEDAMDQGMDEEMGDEMEGNMMDEGQNMENKAMPWEQEQE